MKQILLLCTVLLFFTACDKESEPRPSYKIEMESTKITLDNQGKGTISCKVTPKDLDISKIQIEYFDWEDRTDDMEWGSVGVISATKDTKTPGKWDIVLGMKKDGKPYSPKPEYTYYMYGKVGVYMQIPSDGWPVHSNTFEFYLDIKPSL